LQDTVLDNRNPWASFGEDTKVLIVFFVPWCRGNHFLIHGQMSEKCLDFSAAHIFRMALVVEQDIALSLINVGIFGTEGVVLFADHVAQLIQQLLEVFIHEFARLLADSNLTCNGIIPYNEIT
jgi:hypothetical protein